MAAASKWSGLTQAQTDLVLAGNTDMEKLSRALAATWADISNTQSPRYGPQKKLLVLVLSGALSPVHKGHVEMLLQAGEAIEVLQQQGRPTRSFDIETGGSNPALCQSFAFAAGVLSPSSHSYVKGKLGLAAVQESMRNLMAAQAVAQHPSLCVAPYGMASGTGICSRLDSLLRVHNGVDPKDSEPRPNRTVGETTSTPEYDGMGKSDEVGDGAGGGGPFRVTANFPWSQLRVLPVYGSDFYTRYPTISSIALVIMARVDEEGTAAIAKRLLHKQRINAGDRSVHPDFLLLDPLRPIPDFSSTQVRQAIQLLSIVEPTSGTTRTGSEDERAQSPLPTPGGQETTAPTPAFGVVNTGGSTESRQYLALALDPAVMETMLQTSHYKLYCHTKKK